MARTRGGMAGDETFGITYFFDSGRPTEAAGVFA